MRLTTALILGSGSSTRKAILGEMGIPFTVDKPGIDEKAIRREEPSELVLALGLAKAAALLDGPNGATYASRGDLILTGDQVVVWNGQILEKPENEKEARAFIAGYGESPPSTVGSCVVTDAATLLDSGLKFRHGYGVAILVLLVTILAKALCNKMVHGRNIR